MKNNKNKDVFIEDEIKKSYLNYAVSVIIDRAIPDIRDGLKPVHRRILYAMYTLGNFNNKNYKKSARIVGEVIGKYHPHGDSAVYESIVRLTQKFSLRYPLIDGQGNFGSIDGDSAAAMRYTEIKMSKISNELLYDIDKNTINFIKNYDNTEIIPEILPSRIPNILINGSYGIAVGLATNIPPHNINEIINGCLHLIDNNNSTIEELMNFIKGPDFPTGGIIKDNNDILKSYKTGKGKIYIYSKVIIKGQNIIINEIPYQVNKSNLIQRIVELIKDKKINSINSINDESNKDGIQIVIEIKKKENPNIVLKYLFENTQLKVNFNINMIAIDNNVPKRFNLKNILLSFIKHRKDIIKKKINFYIEKNNLKINIIEPIIISIYNIKTIIDIIINSKSINDIKNKIVNYDFKIINNFNNINNKLFIKYINNKYKINNNNFKFRDNQIKNILNIRLNKLVNIEYKKILYKFNKLLNFNSKLYLILNDNKKLIKIIKNELINIKNKYKDDRITKIEKIDMHNKNIINNNNKIIMLITNDQYIIYINLNNDFKIQKKGGKGKLLYNIKEYKDFIYKSCILQINDDLLLFSNIGKMYIINVYELINKNDNNKKIILSSLISLKKNENIEFILPINKNNFNIIDNKYILISTTNGILKKILFDFNTKVRINGILIIKLNINDNISSVNITNGNNDIILFTYNGKYIRFNENEIKLTSKNSKGIKAIKLNNKDKINSSVILNKNDINEYILTITENGFGKKTLENKYIIKSRLSSGIKSMFLTKRSGNIIKSIKISKNNNIFIINNIGLYLIINSSNISEIGNNTKGYLIMKINTNEKLVDINIF